MEFLCTYAHLKSTASNAHLTVHHLFMDQPSHPLWIICKKNPLQIGTDRCGEHVGSGEDDGKRKVALREAGECGSDDAEGTEVMRRERR
jgi:hypothetical protein